MVDLETTGLDPERDDLVELAAVRFEGETPVGTLGRLVRPARPVPLRIRRLTGLTDPDLEAAVPPADALRDLAEFLARDPAEAPLVIHNAPFDLGFLTAHCARHGVILPARPVVDSAELARLVWPAAPRHSLADLARHLGLDADARHRAEADAVAAGRLFLAARRALVEWDPSLLERLADWLAPVRSPAASAVASVLVAALERRRAQFAAAGARGPSIGTWADRLARRPGRPLPAGAADLAGAPVGTLEAGQDVPPGQDAARRAQAAGAAPVLDLDDLRAIFSATGALGRAMARYEQRPGQVEMAEHVARAFNGGRHLLIEAGTGTGKSLAYLIPAITWAVRTGRRVVVATHTIHLQEQLWEKDLPLVRQVTGLDFRAALVKGKGNYICLRRWDEETRAPEAFLRDDERLSYARLTRWVHETQTGDRSELNLYGGAEDLWRTVSAEHQSCTLANCPWYRQCFAVGARQEAEAAHLIVTNHSVVLSDLKADRRVLPDYQHLILDEAHHLEDGASRHLGHELTSWDVARWLDGLWRAPHGGFLGGLRGRLARLLREPAGTSRDAAEALDRAAAAGVAAVEACRDGLDEAVRAVAGFVAEEGRRGEEDLNVRTLRLRPEHQARPAWDGVAGVRDNLAARLRRLGQALAALADAAEREVPNLGGRVTTNGGSGADRGLGRLAEDARAEALLAAERAGLADRLLRPEAAEVEGDVLWAEVWTRGERPTLALHGSPVHVGEPLRAALFDVMEAVVLTSATLTVAGGFDHLRERLGLDVYGPDRLAAVRVPSPFEYSRQALVCVPTGFPRPPAEATGGYVDVLAGFLVDLARVTGGRMLVLFTSHRTLRQVYDRARAALEAEDLCLLGQGIDGSRTRLLEAFRQDARTVLFGSSSFWEGVDIPGPALSCVVIVRLPFWPPTLPLVEAREEALAAAGRSPFHDFALPQAVIRFQQGFGRLVRSREDRGVVIVVDPRIASRETGYGKVFLASLPGPAFFRGSPDEVRDRVARWLAGEDRRQVRWQPGFGPGRQASARGPAGTQGSPSAR